MTHFLRVKSACGGNRCMHWTGALTYLCVWTFCFPAAYFGCSSSRNAADSSMQLAPMRYTKIEGTAVAVSVKSAAEAKAAVKELRHKKRELKFLRSALLRRQRTARPTPASKSKRAPSLWLRAL